MGVMYRTRSSLPSQPHFSRARFTVTLILCTLVVLSTIGTWWLERQLRGPIGEWARVRATNVATEAINTAVHDVVSRRLDEIEPFTFVTDPSYGSTLLRYNLGPLNRVMSEAVQAIVAAFQTKTPHESHIPLGEVTGLHLLAAWGPGIPARILTTGSVQAEPKVDFRSAGINQVLHRLYVDVTVRMVVIAPFMRDDVVVRQSVIISEEILSGKVPDTFVNLVGYSGGYEEWIALLSATQRE